ncbi:hypothetical protein D0962_23180 [Leptolyngbyaceae cyanobacterium CCMR0082]|uniref:Uncharacterized protein n=1 Tax=Adonisia turfae CCMR0082 TaxID=2304604 RepID=A0A6M0SC22_9CYAN|nr:hypothetical protein [Adonisia turfae]NEZ65623.1 hypothetical protein [Adonisia turfae CCMR0082]
MNEVYIFWGEDQRVDVSGNQDPPQVLGVFGNVAAMIRFAEKDQKITPSEFPDVSEKILRRPAYWYWWETHQLKS